MTAKQYLRRISQIKGQIRLLDIEIAELRIDITSTKGVRYDDDRIQVTPGNPLDSYVIELEALERKAVDLRLEYHRQYDHAREMINQIEPEPYRELLWLRYLENKTLFAVAKEMNYTYKSIQNMHGYALQTFEKKFSKFLK